MPNDPQVPWTDEQWARVNQVIQEEARRARVAATFLPLYGPLPADADFVRAQDISYAAPAAVVAAERPAIAAAYQRYNAAVVAGNFRAAAAAQKDIDTGLAVVGRRQLNIDDRDTIRLATLQLRVPIRNAQ